MKRVEAGEVPGYDPQDPEFIQAIETSEARIRSLRALSVEAAGVSAQISAELTKLSGNLEITSKQDIDQNGTIGDISFTPEQQIEYNRVLGERTKAEADFRAQMEFLAPKYRATLGNWEQVLKNSETELDPQASYDDRIDALQRDTETINTQKETLRLQVVLMEDPENLAKRHELLGGVFDTLSPEQKE